MKFKIYHGVDLYFIHLKKMADISNAFFNFPDKDSKSISNVLANLPLNSRNGLLDYFRLCESIEDKKINTIVRLVKSRLNSDPTIKVVVVVKLVENLERLSSLLSEHHPLVMTSNIKEQISIFNIPTSEHRLLIATRKCIDLQIPLDDDDGNFPRYVFLTLGIDVSKLNRIFTNESKSKTTIQFIYDKENDREIVYIGRKNRNFPRFVEE